MTRRRWIAPLAIGIALLAPSAALGGTHAGADGSGLWAHSNSNSPASRGTEQTSTNNDNGHRGAGGGGEYHTTTSCRTGAEPVCHDPGNCPAGKVEEETYYQAANGQIRDVHFWCRKPGTTPQARPRLTLGLILNAFRQIPLPASPLNLQPSGGTTIVNFPTIAYTTAPTRLTKTLTLLGHVVTFHIHPTTYTWHWGDGTSTTTHDPGAPYRKTNPRLRGDIAHKYEQKATFHPHLDTTYTATYTVDDNNPRPVPGTVTIPGTPHHLTATTYTPVLVSH